MKPAVIIRLIDETRLVLPFTRDSHVLLSLNTHCGAAALCSRETVKRGLLVLNWADVLFKPNSTKFPLSAGHPSLLLFPERRFWIW